MFYNDKERAVSLPLDFELLYGNVTQNKNILNLQNSVAKIENLTCFYYTMQRLIDIYFERGPDQDGVRWEEVFGDPLASGRITDNIPSAILPDSV